MWAEIVQLHEGVLGVQYLESAVIFQLYGSLEPRLQKPYFHR